MIHTLSHLAYILQIELYEIEEIIKDIDSFYYEKREIKVDHKGQPKLKNGKEQVRILNPSLDRLKEIQERISRNILQKLKVPEYAYGGIKGKDNIANAKKHQGKKFIFTTDLKSFFPSIRNGQVYEMYRSFKFSPTVSRCLTQLTTYKGRIPQGAPTSSIVANLVFIKTGEKLLSFCEKHSITFTSYVDDLTFSAPKDFKALTHTLLEIIKSDCYKISHAKTNYKTKLPVVTGIVVKNNNLDLSQATKDKLLATEGKSESQIKGLQNYANRIKNSNIKRK